MMMMMIVFAVGLPLLSTLGLCTLQVLQAVLYIWNLLLDSVFLKRQTAFLSGYEHKLGLRFEKVRW